MKTKLTALFAFLALVFYALKLANALSPLSSYQMTIGTLLALWSYHLSLKVCVENHSYHVLIMILTAGLLTLDKTFAREGTQAIYLMAVTAFHAFAFLMVIVSILFSTVAHAQHADGGSDANDK
jgi:predicted membrane channel-forming protein YqfA (hemolysin III family)